jgi:hypothetical protein
MPTPSTSAKQGKPSKPTAKTCEELGENAIEGREAVIKKISKKKKSERTQAEQSALTKADGKGMTVGSAKSTIRGGSGTMTASSDGTANALIPNGNCKGGTPKQKKGLNKKIRKSKAQRHEKKKAEAGVLCENAYVHPGGGPGAHSEAKIINCLTGMGGAMRGGTVTFNVDWRSSTFDQGETSGMPCANCYAMMCHAVTKCNIKIYLCDHRDPSKPQPLSKKDCKDPDGYKKLCQRVDGNDTPGRG